jgi:hypothetical protein
MLNEGCEIGGLSCRIYLPKCGAKLVWTLESAKVQCNKCFKWIKGSDLDPKAKKISDNDNSEQLKMF